MRHLEHPVAERSVDSLRVRITSCPDDGFWRVAVSDTTSATSVSATTDPDDTSFMWPLIQGAVRGEAAAWAHLSSWGRAALAGRGLPIAS